MNVKRLKYFIAVAEELHFGRAAQRLFMSQPPLSQQIKMLEDELGVQLFERNRHSVKLTPAGSAFLKHAHEIMCLVPIAIEAARQASLGESGQLRIAYTESAMFFDTVLNSIALYREAFPMVNVELREGAAASHIQDVLSGRADVGLVRELPGPLPKGLQALPVAAERLVIALPINHRLAQADKIWLQELAGERFVAGQNVVNRSFNDMLASLFQAAGMSPGVSTETTGMLSALGLVGIGVGVAIMPANIATTNFPNVAFVEIADSNAQSVLYAITASEPALHTSRFLRYLQTQVRQDEPLGDDPLAAGLPRDLSWPAATMAMRRHMGPPAQLDS